MVLLIQNYIHIIDFPVSINLINFNFRLLSLIHFPPISFSFRAIIQKHIYWKKILQINSLTNYIFKRNKSRFICGTSQISTLFKLNSFNIQMNRKRRKKNKENLKSSYQDYLLVYLIQKVLETTIQSYNILRIFFVITHILSSLYQLNLRFWLFMVFFKCTTYLDYKLTIRTWKKFLKRNWERKKN